MKIWALVALAAATLLSCERKADEPKPREEPTVPLLASPVDGAGDMNLQPTFHWQESKSEIGEKISYTLFVAENDKFEGEDVIQLIDIHNVTIELTTPLKRNTKYYWKVVATDAKKHTAESEVRSFTTIGADFAIRLVSPAKDATIEGNETTLTWEGERRPGYTDEVVYDLYTRNGSAEFNFVTKKGLTVTETELNDLKGNGKYFWMIKARVGDEVIAESEVRSFFVPNMAPSAASFKGSVEQNIAEDGVNVSLEWNAGEDADRILLENGTLRAEKLTYDLYIGKSREFQESDKVLANSEALTFSTKLEFSTEYFAKIVTKDEHGATAESEVLSFTTKDEPVTGSFKVKTGSWTDDRDGKTYNTVTINDITWLAENFAYMPYVSDGDKMCYVYGSEATTVEAMKAEENYSKYGVLYTATALADIVPQGWRVATDEDWASLEALSGVEETDLKRNIKSRGSTAHLFIKEGLDYTSPAIAPTNELKLSITYGGYYKATSYNGGFRGAEEFTYFWTSTQGKVLTSSGNFFRAFSKTRTGIERGVQPPAYRMYVRLVKE